MRETSKYKLNQWDKEDRIMREDFNGDNGKLEAALAAVNERVDAVDAAVALTGNCKIVHTSYVGTGTVGSGGACTLTFEKPPLLVLVGAYKGQLLKMLRGCTSALLTFASTEYANTVSWNGNNVSWYHYQDADLQLNRAGTTYYVVTLFAAD